MNPGSGVGARPRSADKPASAADRYRPRPDRNDSSAPRPPAAVGGSVRFSDKGARPADTKPRDGASGNKPTAKPDRPVTTRNLSDRYRPRPGDVVKLPPDARSSDQLPTNGRPIKHPTSALVDRYHDARPIKRPGTPVSGPTLQPRPSPNNGAPTVRPTTRPTARPATLRPRSTLIDRSTSSHFAGSCYGPTWDPCWSWRSCHSSFYSPALTWSLGICHGSFWWGWSSWYPWHCRSWCNTSYPFYSYYYPYYSYAYYPCYSNCWWDPWCHPYRRSLWWWPTTCYVPTYVYLDADPDDSGVDVPVVAASAPAPAAEAPAAAPAPAPVELTPMEQARRYVDLGDFYFREGRYRDAADTYAKARTLVPDDATIHFVLADAVFALGDYHFAAFLIGEGMRFDPALARADTDKRTLYRDPAVFDKQMKTLEQYLVEKPYDAMAHLTHGYNLKFSGRRAEAGAAFRRVLEIDPASEAAKLLLESLTPAAESPKSPDEAPEAPAASSPSTGEKGV